MLENIYKDILNKLKSSVPELKLIDLDTGQLELQMDSYPILCPAVFIDFQGPVNWDNVSQHVYLGNVSIIFRIVFDIIEDMNNLTPDTTAQEAINKLGLQSKIHKNIVGLSGSNYNSLTLLSGPTSNKREDGYKVYEYTYVTNVRNSIALPEYTKMSNIQPLIENKKTAK